jgi:hypothetical protein
MQWLASWTRAGSEQGVDFFDVGNVGVKVPKAILACVRLDVYGTRVP